jgi:hypothetical protein
VTGSQPHSHVSNRCMICTSCHHCTGYGANCVRCRGKDRSADSGKECGCGAGKSGCSKCGKCEKCTGSAHDCSGTMTPSASTAPAATGFSFGAAPVAPVARFSHPGSWPGCGGNPEGTSNCSGGGNCGGGCRQCGASTHWSCCGSTDRSSAQCVAGITQEQATRNKDLVFAAHSTAVRVRDIPGVSYGPSIPVSAAEVATQHSYTSDRCRICTKCHVCTEYGPGCCECTGKNRSPDSGKDCGCGQGKSGCSKCGQCEKCGGSNPCPGLPPPPGLVQHTKGPHKFVRNRCMICTECNVCTGIYISIVVNPFFSSICSYFVIRVWLQLRLVPRSRQIQREWQGVWMWPGKKWLLPVRQM